MNTKTLTRALIEVPMLADGCLVAMLLEDTAAELPFFKALKSQMAPEMTVQNRLATIPIKGTLAASPSAIEMAFKGFEDSGSIISMLESAGNDSGIAGALLDIDSPGGFLIGAGDIPDAVARLSAKKPVVAFTGGTMASLAYWAGSQAREVIATPMSSVGSIGAMTTFVDISRMLENQGIKVRTFTNSGGDLKGMGSPGTQLTDAQVEHIQNRLDNGFALFRDAVSSKRPSVKKESMRGQTFYGGQAKSLGLVDRLGDKSFALSVLASMAR